MSSILYDNLVDDLLPVVDELRGDLHPVFGSREYKVFIVRRTWSGFSRGDGQKTEAKVEIFPPPLVTHKEGLHYALTEEGKFEEGTLIISEISLANYQEDDLTGGDIPANQEFFWVLQDAWGQGIRSRAYVLQAPPQPDRLKSIGWIVKLRRVDTLDYC